MEPRAEEFIGRQDLQGGDTRSLDEGAIAARGARRDHQDRGRGERVARGLGWFSVGLGVAQLLAPRAVSRLAFGGDGRRTRAGMATVGLREIVAGVGLLTNQRRPAPWLWARVAGDVMDLALLASALPSRRGRSAHVLGAMGAVLGVTVLDALTSIQMTRQARAWPAAGRGMKVACGVTIYRPIEEVYRFWRDFQNLPRFMAHLVTVQVQDSLISRWVARGPAGSAVEWAAEITEDRPHQVIAWRSLEDADVPNSGKVRFTPGPGGRGTEVHLEIEYRPPAAGRLGLNVAKMLGHDPARQVAEDLRRFKQVMETGEVIHSDASIHRDPHPARPAGENEGQGESTSFGGGRR